MCEIERIRVLGNQYSTRLDIFDYSEAKPMVFREREIGLSLRNFSNLHRIKMNLGTPTYLARACTHQLTTWELSLQLKKNRVFFPEDITQIMKIGDEVAA